jgi:hypothetical protein
MQDHLESRYPRHERVAVVTDRPNALRPVPATLFESEAYAQWVGYRQSEAARGRAEARS